MMHESCSCPICCPWKYLIQEPMPRGPQGDWSDVFAEFDMKQYDVIAAADEIGGWLSRAGCVFELEADNRGGRRASRYLYVRKPFVAKVRVADHRSNWIEKNAQRSRILMLDVGPHGLTAQEAIAALEQQAAGE